MRIGNIFSRICLSVSLCFCLSVCLSVQAITFEPLHIGTSFLVWMCILTISRSSLSVKIIVSRSRSCVKKWLFIYFNLLFICMWLQVINDVKVTHQGQGHTPRLNQCHDQIKVIFKERYSYIHGWFAFESKAFLFLLLRFAKKSWFPCPMWHKQRHLTKSHICKNNSRAYRRNRVMYTGILCVRANVVEELHRYLLCIFIMWIYRTYFVTA